MLAYNHKIKFITGNSVEPNIESSASKTISIKMATPKFLNKKLNYEMSFFNNQGRDLALYTERKFARSQRGQNWSLEVKDVVNFYWKSGSYTLGYLPKKDFTPQLLKYWTLHIILPIFFTIEEQYDFLHAGAVEVESKPIIFIAESFGGKSTITDFFMHQGHKVISDDKVATYEECGAFYASPSHPYHRPYRKMEDLGQLIKNFSQEVKPIQAIYDLKKGKANCNIEIIEITGIEKFKSLRYSSEINMPFLKQQRFLYLMRMAAQVSVFQIVIPWKLERLSEVYETIIDHNQYIKQAS